uniref:Thioredoxin domain-containing protein n=1 Tax=viral metagenome TaxID=1070528 RepID=A0A6C0CKN3_9ZZZZ
MPKPKSYTKPSDKAKVLEEMSQDVPMIVRIYSKTCGACQMSEKPWKAFCNGSPPDIKVLEVEQEAVPDDVMMGVEGFPTYALHTKDGENKHHTGALMTPDDIRTFIAAP